MREDLSSLESPAVVAGGYRDLGEPETRGASVLGGGGDQSRLSVNLAKNSDHAQCVTMRDPHSIWVGGHCRVRVFPSVGDSSARVRKGPCWTGDSSQMA